ncbi:hypothetical protein [Calidithermus timidus]|jgi:hypothetical protein|nr:hypothetical protein [Calidithermus timidus]
MVQIMSKTQPVSGAWGEAALRLERLRARFGSTALERVGFGGQVCGL